MTLRRATTDDLPFLTRLVEHPANAATLSPATIDELEPAIAAGEVLVAERDGVPVGGVKVVVISERSRVAQLRSVVIDPERQGEGLGVAMLRAVVEHLFTERGLHRVQAEAYAFNTRGVRVFETAGFEVEGRRRRAWWRQDAFHDGVLLGVLSD